MSRSSAVNRILHGLLRVVSRLLWALLLVGSIVAVSVGVVYPLWLFATTFPSAYSLFCGIVLLIGLGALLVRRVLAWRIRRAGRIADEQAGDGASRSHRKMYLIKAVGTVLLICLIYLSILFFGTGMILPGVVVSFCAVVAIGWLASLPRFARRTP